jgi:hypothetical protein
MNEDVLRGLELVPKKVEDTMMRTVNSMIHCLPREFTQRAALLAAMCSSHTKKVAERYLGKLGPVQFSTSRDNAGFIAPGHEIKKAPKTRLNNDKGVVEACVRSQYVAADGPGELGSNPLPHPNQTW